MIFHSQHTNNCTYNIMSYTCVMDELIMLQYFAAPDLNTLVPLERPLLTDRIRLRPVEWFASAASSVEYICLGVGLYGCLATESKNLKFV